MTMKTRILLASIAALAVAACDSSTNPAPPADPNPATFDLQVVHASPDAPSVNLLIDGTVPLIGGQPAEGLEFKGTLGPVALQAGSYEITVQGNVASGTVDVIGPADIPFNADTRTTVVAINDVANIEPAILEQPNTPVSAGAARVFVLHGAATAPEVDVYVTAPGADLTATAPLGTFEFRETLGPVEVTAGDYQIRVTVAGDPTAVVYDSGTRTLPAGLDAVLVATPNVEGGSAAITLLIQDANLGALEFADTNAPASLRVVHASPDTPDVDVLVDGSELLGDVPYTAVSDTFEVAPGSYEVAVTIANDPSTVGIDLTGMNAPTLEAGIFYNVLAVGSLADGSLQPLILTDDQRSIGVDAKVRVVHGAPGAGTVDVYVVAPGTDITTATPAIPAFDFLDNTGFITLPAGSYEVSVTAAGDPTIVAIDAAPLTIVDGGVYTAIARDAQGGGAPFDLILIDDTP